MGQILFNDEAHFSLDGYVNKQNGLIGDEEQSEDIQDLPFHPEKTTVWFGLWAGGIIGSYFFKNIAGEKVTINGDRFRVMIIDYLMPKNEARDLGDIGFQQDGASFHTRHQSMYLLTEDFDEQIISRFGPVDWPPRLRVITPLNFFLGRKVKSKVYADYPDSIQAGKRGITRFIRQLVVEMLERVIVDWTQRMNILKRSRGQHLKDIILKKYMPRNFLSNIPQ